MSDILNGNAANITSPLARTVTALTSGAGGVVRVTTSVPHLFGPSDRVYISTAVITGYFTINIIDSTHVDLQGTTYSSTATGTITDYSLTPQILVPTDGDTFSMQISGMLSCLQGLMDRTQWLASQVANLQQASFAGAGTLKVPPGVVWMVAVMCGGGGGGEGGKRGETGGSIAGIYPQGGGGAGAPLVCQGFVTSPGDLLTITPGTGGAGGAARGGAGGDGVASTVIDGTSNLVVAAFGGAGCGCGTENWSGASNPALWNSTVSNNFADSLGAIAPGALGITSLRAKGCPYSTGPKTYGYTSAASFAARFQPEQPYSGGSVAIITGSYVIQPGGVALANNVVAGPTVGGNGGTSGTTSGSYYGGCGGGGGGASAFGFGGNGGNGGNANASGTGANATAGAAGSSYGAGGGGGGCGGDGSAAGGTAAAGGAGAGGFVMLFWASNAGA
jgi:hypothetical protein